LLIGDPYALASRDVRTLGQKARLEIITFGTFGDATGNRLAAGGAAIGLLRAIDFSRFPLIYNSINCCVNIIVSLNTFLIGTFSIGGVVVSLEVAAVPSLLVRTLA
jgi:hypothetical protein